MSRVLTPGSTAAQAFTGVEACAEGSHGKFYSPVIDPDFYLSQLRGDLDAILGGLQLSVLDVAILHCDGWTLADLAEHLGQGNQWAAAAITEQRGDYHPPPPPTDPAALAPWFAETTSILLAALDVDPDSPAWTLWPPHTSPSGNDAGAWRQSFTAGTSKTP